MKKKTYMKPEMTVLCLNTSAILVNGSTTIDQTTPDYGKYNQWEDEGDLWGE